MRVGFFGRLGERIGREVELEMPESPCSVADLRRHLADLYPYAAADLVSGGVRACVDEAIVPDSHVIGPGQKVEFLPPLSGG